MDFLKVACAGTRTWQAKSDVVSCLYHTLCEGYYTLKQSYFYEHNLLFEVFVQYSQEPSLCMLSEGYSNGQPCHCFHMLCTFSIQFYTQYMATQYSYLNGILVCFQEEHTFSSHNIPLLVEMVVCGLLSFFTVSSDSHHRLVAGQLALCSSKLSCSLSNVPTKILYGVCVF